MPVRKGTCERFPSAVFRAWFRDALPDISGRNAHGRTRQLGEPETIIRGESFCVF